VTLMSAAAAHLSEDGFARNFFQGRNRCITTWLRKPRFALKPELAQERHRQRDAPTVRLLAGDSTAGFGACRPLSAHVEHPVTASRTDQSDADGDRVVSEV